MTFQKLLLLFENTAPFLDGLFRRRCCGLRFVGAMTSGEGPSRPQGLGTQGLQTSDTPLPATYAGLYLFLGTIPQGHLIFAWHGNAIP